MPSDFILDTVALRVMTFAHRDGLTILQESLSALRLSCPGDVYNHDERTIPIEMSDEGLSELARGLRFAERRVSASVADAQRYQRWLDNAAQLAQSLESGSLVVETLSLDELLRRDELTAVYGIGTGEAACLALMERQRRMGVFVSSDHSACRVAAELGLSFVTLEDVLDRWIRRLGPAEQEFESMIEGMRMARYTVPNNVLTHLRTLI